MASDPKGKLRRALERVARRVSEWSEATWRQANAAPVFVEGGVSAADYGPPEPGVYLDSAGEWQSVWRTDDA